MAIELSFNLGIPPTPTTSDDELFNQLLPLYQAVNTLAYNLDLYTGNVRKKAGLSLPEQLTAPTIITATLTENVTRGSLLHLSRSGTTLIAYKAGGAGVASNLTHGVADSAGSVNDVIPVILFGYLNGHITGMTPGASYYTSDSVTGAASNGAALGNRQPIGFALSDTTFFFNPHYGAY